MIIRVERASWSEPYWWVEDKAGFRYIMPLAIHRTTHEDGGAVIWSLIVGPICLRLGYRTSNAKIDGGSAVNQTDLFQGIPPDYDDPWEGR